MIDIGIQKCYETVILTIYTRRKFFEKYLIAKKLELKSYQYYYIQPNGKLQMLKISIIMKTLVYFCPMSKKRLRIYMGFKINRKYQISKHMEKYQTTKIQISNI